jgi:histidinol-phosphate aminotransferase
MLGLRLHTIALTPGRYLKAEELIKQVDATSKVLFLPNPSQPIENLFDLEQIRMIAAHCDNHNILLAVDEAYHFMGSVSALPLMNSFDNVLVMRTFSKAFGAASIRLGYTIGSQKAVKPLAALRLAHESNAMSLHIGCVLLDHFDTVVSASIERILEGRNFLRQSCLDYGWQAWGKAANYVLIDLANEELRDHAVAELVSRGIYVKGNFRKPLQTHILVTCGPLEMMRTFFDNLKNIVETTKT